MEDRHVVQYSGGVGSWAAAKLVAQKYGTDNLTLLFTDVLDEHADLYRFLEEGAANIGVPVTRIVEGRTPRQVMTDEKFIGNSAKDPCSKILKRQFMDRWFKENCDIEHTVRYIGIDWTEINRFTAFRERMKPWRTDAPLCTNDPPLSKNDAFAMLEREGIQPPYLNLIGFSHNNCGGACIKAGQGQWAKLLDYDPKLYAEWETWEAGMRTTVGDHSILRDRRGGGDKSLTLKAFRLRVEGNQQIDLLEIGGCGCAIDDSQSDAVTEPTFCRACGASIPHRIGEGRCPECIQHLPTKPVA